MGYAGYGGDWCQGKFIPLPMGPYQRGYLAQGEWAYYRVVIDIGSTILRQGFLLSFANDAGHAIVVGRMNVWPGLNNESDVWR
jgi:hypothetical protein